MSFDLAFTKRMKFTERFGTELRVEGFNIFNHPVFQNPANGITGANFGLISSTIIRPDQTTSARQIQVALRLNF